MRSLVAPGLMQVEKKSGAFTLKVLATKVACSNCIIGRANKSCKHTLRKKRCLVRPAASKCSAHGKKPEEPTAA